MVTTSTALTAITAGCVGGSVDEEPTDATQEPIEKSASELVLSLNQFESGWQEVDRPDENETEFEKLEDGDLHVVNSQAWLVETIDEGKDEYGRRVSEIDSSTSDVSLGVEAVQYEVDPEVVFLFRDANAIGRLQYMFIPESGSQSPDPDTAKEYANLMYENFR